MHLTRQLFLGFMILLSVKTQAQDLHQACYNGDFQTVKRIITEKPDRINSFNEFGRFPLEMAAQTGQLEIVEFLIDHGADVKQARNGSTALHMAAIYGGNTEVVRLLLENGADINTKNSAGSTPLNMAVYGKQKEIADLLIDQGGVMNLEKIDYTDLLSTAASSGIKRVVDIALTGEINYSYETEAGNTLLHSAAEGGLVELAIILINKGIELNGLNRYDMSPLHFAAINGHNDMIKLLVAKGAQIEARSKNDKTALHYTREYGKVSTEETLIDLGARTDGWKFPPLKGNYFNMEVPDTIPQLFSPGIVSEYEHFERSCLAYAPDYSSLYWSSDYTKTGFYEIVFMEKIKGQWTSPKIAPFCENLGGGSPVFSKDGKQLFFSSTRPVNSGGEKSNLNIWVLEKEKKGWSEPVLLDIKINTDLAENPLSVAQNGTLYFRRGTGLYSAKRSGNQYEEPKKEDILVPEGLTLLSVYVEPEESWMLAELMSPRGAGIYFIKRTKNGTWSEPVSLSEKIGVSGIQRFPSITPDGKYLTFLRVSDDTGFYWVSVEVLKGYL